MAQKPDQTPPVIDPDCVPETLCDGQFYIHPHGNLATLTFTHSRPVAAELFRGVIKPQPVVGARITMTLDNFAALRDLLNGAIKSNEPMPTSGTAGATKH